MGGSTHKMMTRIEKWHGPVSNITPGSDWKLDRENGQESQEDSTEIYY